jgi:MOSC domain-containing protein YiiM
MYAGSHYPLWEAELARPMAAGAFGENLTVEGLAESTVCIGDVLDVGEVRFEVSKPRQPCSTLARRHQLRDLVARVLENGRSGWYLRVLREGALQAGQPIQVVARPHPEWPVRRAARVMVERARDRESAAELSRCPALAPDWRATLAKV